MDLRSRLRSIVRGSDPGEASPGDGERPARHRAPLDGAGRNGGLRELTYEPDPGAYEASLDPDRIGEVLGGQSMRTNFGACLVIDRRYEADRRHGSLFIGDCEVADVAGLKLLDPTLAAPEAARTVFIDLETTGISGGAGTVAFLVGCGYFDLGAFQVRQFLLTSYSAERALLAAVGGFFEDADLIVSYNGKTFDLPVMETRWTFHRMDMPLDGVPHFDMLHPARRLWSSRTVPGADEGSCRLSTLERVLFDVSRVGDVPGCEIPSRFFRFLRTGDPRPLEPVLEHNRLDLVSLAAVTARAVRLTRDGADACRDVREALALGRVYERCGLMARAAVCYRRASCADLVEVRSEALYRLGLGFRRARRYGEAADCWRALLTATEPARVCRHPTMRALRKFATEALAIHHEHRDRDLPAARELALFALEAAEESGSRSDGIRHRLARLERKIARPRLIAKSAQLFS